MGGVQRREVLLETMKSGAAKRILPGGIQKVPGWLVESRGLGAVVVKAGFGGAPPAVRADDARDRVAGEDLQQAQAARHRTVREFWSLNLSHCV